MSTPEHVVVLGGGLAGAKTVEALRDQGFTGAVTLLAAETHLPYERPPLSKTYLAGSSPFTKAVVHPQEWYRDNAIDLPSRPARDGRFRVARIGHVVHRATVLLQ